VLKLECLKTASSQGTHLSKRVKISQRISELQSKVADKKRIRVYSEIPKRLWRNPGFRTKTVYKPGFTFCQLLITKGKPGNPGNPGVFGDESGSERENGELRREASRAT
jgi:superfamily I DNA and/or RNA helicase